MDAESEGESKGESKGHDPSRCFGLSAHAHRPYTDAAFQDGDCLLFGSESRGLPAETLADFGARALFIPMPAHQVRSLNLATAVGIVLYEAIRALTTRTASSNV